MQTNDSGHVAVPVESADTSLKDLATKGEMLATLVEAWFRKGTDAVPESLQDVTEEAVIEAMYALRAAIAKARAKN